MFAQKRHGTAALQDLAESVAHDQSRQRFGVRLSLPLLSLAVHVGPFLDTSHGNKQ